MDGPDRGPLGGNLAACNLRGTALDGLEEERKVKETEELESRIEALEAKIQPKVEPTKRNLTKGVRRW